jgi:hypothetical protein
METGTITLGERTLEVRPFTFDQLRVILPQLETAWTHPFVSEGLPAAREVIRTALSQMDDAEFNTLVASIPQIFEALATIGKVSGLKALGEQMAQMVHSTGTGSTPPSAPTQDGPGAQSAA